MCFSIKKAKDEQPVASNKSALPVEDSTDDEDGENNNKEDPTPTNNSTNNQNLNQNENENNESLNQKNCDKTEENNSSNNNDNNKQLITSASQIIEIEDPIMELIDLTDDLEDRRDAKRGNLKKIIMLRYV